MIKNKRRVNYLLEQEEEDKMFNCVNCGKPFKIEYLNDQTPSSVWCNKCRGTQNIIKKKFKMENQSKDKKDPYQALAEMKVLLDKTKPFLYKTQYPESNGFINDKTVRSRPATEVIEAIGSILNKVKIPTKYLIAESL